MALAGYVTPAEFVNFYDSRRVCELLSVTGTPVLVSDLSDDQSAAYQKLMKYFILPAAADIDSACQVGRRYSRADLEQIIDDANNNPEGTAYQKRAALLRKLNADLAHGALVASRGYSAENIDKLSPNYAMAQRRLEELYQGVRILDLEDVIAAGVPSTTDIGKRTLTSTQFNKLFGIWPDSTYPYWGYY